MNKAVIMQLTILATRIHIFHTKQVHAQILQMLQLKPTWWKFGISYLQSVALVKGLQKEDDKWILFAYALSKIKTIFLFHDEITNSND